MVELTKSGFDDFDRLLAVIRITRELLDRVAGDGALPPGGSAFLADAALAHLDDVQSGFVGSLRAERVGSAELRYLLRLAGGARVPPAEDDGERRAAIAEAVLDRRRSARDRQPLRQARSWDLAALAHARVVLALLPRLPDDAVRFPTGRRTYADIPIPSGPAELSARIDELERQLWSTAVGRASPPTDPAFRRTYGFFDAADQLGWRAVGRIA